MDLRSGYRDSIEEYLRELNPKYYKQLNKAGQLKDYLDKLTGWASNTHNQMRTKEMERQIKLKLRPTGTWEQIQELYMLDLQIQEHIRLMLEQQVRSVD